MTGFDAEIARKTFQERIDSLDNDVQRCFWPIKDGPGPAFFPAVLYAFATIDYLSSCWAGWNDSKGDRSKSQTKRITDFLVKYCQYENKESQIAVNVWRHKLMHTGEPRVVRNVAASELYEWEINTNGQTHMKLVHIDGAGRYRLQINPVTLVHDLRNGVLGPGGYLQDLRQSPNLQKQFQDFIQETNTYTISIVP